MYIVRSEAMLRSLPSNSLLRVVVPTLLLFETIVVQQSFSRYLFSTAAIYQTTALKVSLFYSRCCTGRIRENTEFVYDCIHRQR